MKYLICYLIGGEAKLKHEYITGDLSARFGIPDLALKVPPHVTLFRPLVLENADVIKSIVEEFWMINAGSGSFNMNMFGCFRTDVVFAGIFPDESVYEAVGVLREEIRKKISAKEDYPDWKPHASLATDLEKEKFDAIYSYMRCHTMSYRIPFDNVTILRKGSDGTWELEVEYR